MEAELEAAKRVGWGVDDKAVEAGYPAPVSSFSASEAEKLAPISSFVPPGEEEPAPLSTFLVRGKVNLLCLIHLCVTAGAALLQLVTIIVVLFAECRWARSLDWMQLDWMIALVVIFLALMVPSVVVAVMTFRKRKLGTLFTNRFQMFQKIMLGLAIATFLAELIELIWLCMTGPLYHFGSYACDSFSATVFLNVTVVVVECARLAFASTMFHYGKMI